MQMSTVFLCKKWTQFFVLLTNKSIVGDFVVQIPAKA